MSSTKSNAPEWDSVLKRYHKHAGEHASAPADYDAGSDQARRCIYGAIRVSLEDSTLQTYDLSKDVHETALRCMAFFPSGWQVHYRFVMELWQLLIDPTDDVGDEDFKFIYQKLAKINMLSVTYPHGMRGSHGMRSFTLCHNHTLL